MMVAIEDCEDEEGQELNLFPTLCSKDVDLEGLAQDWAALCSKNQAEALSAFVQLLFMAAGGRCPPTHLAATLNEILRSQEEDDPATLDRFVDTVALELGDKKQRVPQESPLASKMVRVNIAVFVQRVMQLWPSNILFDNYMLDKIVSFLGAFSTCRVRPYRHVGTFVGLKICTGLLNVLTVMDGEAEAAAAQYMASGSRVTSPNSAARFQTLQERACFLRTQRDTLFDLVHGYLVKKMLRDRFRDVDGEIAAACISELGVWMEMSPDIFLKDNYLRIYKLLLAHESPIVRRSCLEVLQILFRRKDFHKNMEAFSDRCKALLADMILDQSLDVAVLAVGVLSSFIGAWGGNFLGPSVVSLVVGSLSRRRRLARAAARVLLQLLQSDECPPLRLAILFDNTAAALPCIIPLHMEPLVEVLQSVAGSKGFVGGLGGWDMLISPLLSDEELSLITERLLVAILCAASSQLPAKSKEVSDLTITLAPELPVLLRRFQEDSDAVADLLSIALNFNPELFITHAFDDVADRMLEMLMSLMEMHGGSETVLGLCLEVAVRCKLQEREGSWAQLESALLDEFWNLHNKCFSLKTKEAVLADDHIIPSMRNVLTKLVVYYEHHEISSLFNWDPVFTCCSQLKSISPQVSTLCMQLCHQSLLWGLKLKRTNGMQRQLTNFYNEVSSLLRHANYSLREGAFFVMCNILLLFAERPNESSEVEPSLTVTDETQRALWRFVKHAVITSTDNDVDEIDHRSKVLEAYCNLISYGAINMKSGAHVLRLYSKDFKQFEAIVKITAENMLQINAYTFANVVVSVLTDGFSRSSINAPALRKIQELSGRLAAFFSSHRTQKALLLLFKKAFAFTFSHSPGNGTNHSFALVLLPFVGALQVDAANVVLQMLQAHKQKAEGEESPKSKETSDALQQLEAGLARRVGKSRATVRVSSDVSAGRPSTPSSLCFPENVQSSTPLQPRVLKKPRLDIIRICRPTRSAAQVATKRVKQIAGSEEDSST